MKCKAGDIVVADDNELLLNVLSEMFRDSGYSVRTASDGLNALAEIRTQAPSILLSDLVMPRMSGYELLSIMRRRYPWIKVVAMSDSYVGQGVPRGIAADAFYEKGATSVARLLEIVNGMADQSELRAMREATPIWIPGPEPVPTGGGNSLFACPECLRAYPDSLSGPGPVFVRNCPCCLYRVQIAVVPPTTQLDRSTFVDFHA